MKTGSVCTGYGGLDMAVREVLGGELAWVADIDPGANAILAHRFPSVPNLGDISAADWSAVEPVDMLCAGFPCQDVSCAGGRAGLRKGNRTGAWAYVARAINELRPSLVVLENVRGLLSAGADSDLESCPWCVGEAGNEHPLRALGAVLGDLADLGYDARWAVVSAADAGAPHRRERVFITARPAADAEAADERRGLGTRGGTRRHAPVRIETCAEPGDGNGPSAADSGSDEPRGHVPVAVVDRRESRNGPGSSHRGVAEDADRTACGEWRVATPGQAAGGRSRTHAGGSGGVRAAADTERAELAREPQARRKAVGGTAVAGSGPRALADTPGHGRNARRAEPAGIIGGPDAAVCGDGLAADPPSQRHGDTRAQGERGIPAAPVSDAPADTHGGGRGPDEHDDAPRQPDLDWGPYGLAIHRWGRVTGWAAPAPTEPGRTGQRLSPRFVEWMMGLPEGWVTDVPGLSRNAQLKALGNGVVPQQATMALRLLLERAGIPSLVAAEEVA